MAKKKRAVRKKSTVKAKVSKKPQAAQGKLFSEVKLGLVVRNLILFILLFLLSYILSVVVEGDVLSNLFDFLWIIFAFVALAFFIGSKMD
jgi:hypothetical protein